MECQQQRQQQQQQQQQHQQRKQHRQQRRRRQQQQQQQQQRVISRELAPFVHHYKCSFNFSAVPHIRQHIIDLLSSSIVHKRRHEANESYAVVTLPSVSNCTFTIFHSGFMNVTALRKHSVALETGETLRKALGLTGPAPPCQIDNMTASGQLCIRSNEYLYLDKLCERAKRNSYKASVEFIRFNVEHFPGCQIRTCSWGTINCFSSGKWVGVGVKSFENLANLRHLICHLVNHSDCISDSTSIDRKD
jgi:TATA-box binding protein (TBP) (component of TFIID and TFIIIB)